MIESVWLPLSLREKTILLDALTAIRASKRVALDEIDAITLKLVHSEPHPNITVGVQGGLVQWTLGNPFPIRVCDYDGDGDELPDVDERGQRCRMWFEPADERSVE
jgi:hypothetical protein